ncbi:hypothetical protein A9Y76_10820 [Ralstonia insidiosa]|jgi:nitric oxide reductase NorD protein|uniref:VWFA domain-containing protein n=3 Tax=Burkholderiaceae TaxID=119060 RepID=A0A191ZXX5_9RALS|nr:hypothetical protein A9Y76_10820 [Ralstonia insidiosa]EPX97116.1 hypothetical protein C404_14985 [Ralstonia sp. AU12-08]CAJ0723046.1 hypothetical protein R38712_01590 [Ralstonia pickettii]
MLRAVDQETHEALLEALPRLADHLPDEAACAALAELLAQVATEDAAAALALTQRFANEPEIAADAVGLRKWVLHGLQTERTDLKRRRAHFQWGDPRLFSDQRTESDTAHLLARREALLHYLGGFVGHRQGLDLHEPQDPKLPQPAASVNEDLIRMPRRFDGIAAADRDLLYRATMAHIAAHLRFSPLRRAAGNRRPMLLATMSLLEDARVERLMMKEYPGLRAVWGRFHDATRESVGFQFEGLTSRLARALHDPSYEDRNDWVTKARTAFEEIAARDLGDVAAFDRLARELSIAMGRMRQVVAPHYRPYPSYRDDNALLWDFLSNAPVDEAAEEVVTDFEIRAEAPPPQDDMLAKVDLRRRYRYPEWDHQLEALRDEWVTVIEPMASARAKSVAARKAAVAHRLKLKGLDRTPDRSIRLNRLPEGDELDLNAAVDSAIERRSGIAPDGRVFRRHGRRRRKTAIVLLMDLSVSTGRFVPGSFTTVMEVEKRAATVVAQALDQRRDRVAIHGFASNGRHEVHYRRIKDFDEPFGDAQQAALESLEGDLSTRMGAAIRHAAVALDGEQADQKVILVLTDGEPSDIDVVEDDYLVEDARHAVATAAGRGIRTFCLTLDRRADAYVRRIFGARNYMIAERADTFAGWAGQTLVRLAAH